MAPQEVAPEASSHAPTYRPDIDGLRAVAVLSVVAFHAYPTLLTGGFIGVDVFFVVSGFLISTIILGGLQRQTFDFIEFYARRVRRIFPALILVLIVSYAVGWVVLLPDEYRQLGKHVAAGAGFASNVALWSEAGYFDVMGATKPLLHLWSLGVEEQFYLVWPLLLWLAWKRRDRLVALLLVVVAGSFALNVATVGRDTDTAFYLPHTRLWELACGGVLASISAAGPAGRTRARVPSWLMPVFDRPHLWSATGLSLLAIGFVGLDSTRAFPGLWAALPVVGALAVIAAGPGAWVNRVVLSHPVVVWVGLISYPLYLWHWALLSFVRIVDGGDAPVTVRTAAVVLSVVLAWATYAVIERPVRFGTHGGAKAAALLLVMVVVGGVGYVTYLRDGFGERFPKLIGDLAQYRYDETRGYRVGRCLLRPDQDYSGFQDCEPAVAESRRPTLLLWGDSHAAHLYQGYLAAVGDRFTIVQRTASGCPPLVGVHISDRKHCHDINDHVMDFVRDLRPDKVVMAARWGAYEITALRDTVERLRALAIERIDLVGPVPEWKGSLRRQLYDYQRTHVPHVVPTRMQFGLNEESLRLDTVLRQATAALRVNYLSPRDVLCNGDGCLTMLGETADDLVAWDSAHLTERGSLFLVGHFPKH